MSERQKKPSGEALGEMTHEDSTPSDKTRRALRGIASPCAAKRRRNALSKLLTQQVNTPQEHTKDADTTS
ncbi:MAG: hypothetical protein HQL86_07800 [Magnetococcales bacterium]|nr:hypothetical protein [Magnetococcales bacterium]